MAAKRLRPCVQALLLLCAFSVEAAELPPGVPADHWAAPAVRRSVEAGLFSVGTAPFEGQRKVSRYELAAVMDRFLSVFDQRAHRIRWRIDEVIRRLHGIETRLSRIAERQKIRKALSAYTPEPEHFQLPLEQLAPEGALQGEDARETATAEAADTEELLRVLQKKLGVREGKNVPKDELVETGATGPSLVEALAKGARPTAGAPADGEARPSGFSNPRLRDALNRLRARTAGSESSAS